MCVEYVLKIIKKLLLLLGWMEGARLTKRVSRVSEAAVLSTPPTFLRDQRLEHHDGSVVARPSVHLPVTVTPFFGELVPRFRLREQLGNCALGQPQHVFGEQSLSNIMHA